MISLICGIQKTKLTNKQTIQNENRFTDTENKWVVLQKGGVWEGRNR